MPEVTPLQAAINNAQQAVNAASHHPELCTLYSARSWHAFLDHVAATWGDGETAGEAYSRGYENAKIEHLDQAAEIAADTGRKVIGLLPRVESLEVRADLAEAVGMKLPITPEEPDPGRDWSRVEAHLFKPSGKWMYSVWLNYSDLRSAPYATGCGPSGWYFAGAAMAEQALAIATDNGTSGVTIRELGTYWHLFVPHPPQGFPIWVRPALAENENQLTFDHFQDAKTRLEAAEAKLAAIRGAVEDYETTMAGTPLFDEIQEVLDR